MQLFDWDGTGFYRGYAPLKSNSDKKEPIIPYTKESIEQQTARGHQSYSGILADDTALFDTDDSQNSELILKIIKGEQLKCLVSDREGGQGLHSSFFDIIQKDGISVCRKYQRQCCVIMLLYTFYFPKIPNMRESEE